jgi:hypothetical protein
MPCPRTLSVALALAVVLADAAAPGCLALIPTALNFNCILRSFDGGRRRTSLTTSPSSAG